MTRAGGGAQTREERGAVGRSSGRPSGRGREGGRGGGRATNLFVLEL